MRLPRSVDDAVAAEQAGERLDFLFFWGHRLARDGELGPGCLSQWWPVEFTENGRVFRSAEHYMMTHKAWLFDDETAAAKILAADTPGEAKKLGRTVRGFDKALWTTHRYQIVVRGNVAKFGQRRKLREFLLGTRGRVLVEASPRDRIWGIGLSATNELAASPTTWRGLNLLGFALMDARDKLGTE